jgi:hypothetical protein
MITRLLFVFALLAPVFASAQDATGKWLYEVEETGERTYLILKPVEKCYSGEMYVSIVEDVAHKISWEDQPAIGVSSACVKDDVLHVEMADGITLHFIFRNGDQGRMLVASDEEGIKLKNEFDRPIEYHFISKE